MKGPHSGRFWLAVLGGLLLLVAGAVWYAMYAHETLRERGYRASIRGLEETLRREGAAMNPEARLVFERSLELLRANAPPPYPVPVGAVLFKNRDSGEWQLSLAYLDGEADIEGIRVLEVDGQTGASITEDYPCWHHLSDKAREHGFNLAPFRVDCLPVRLRRDIRDRKDETIWGQWAEAVREGDLPTIWIGCPGQLHTVEILLYNRKGTASPSIPVCLHSGISGGLSGDIHQWR